MTDQPPTDHTPLTDRPPTDHTGGADMLPIAEAAFRRGVTVNALRQRIKRGTLRAVKTQAGWLVATDHRPTTTDHRPTTTDHRPTTIEPAGLAPLAAMMADLARENRDLAAAVDLAPLVDHIAALEGQVRQLTEAATIWQVRAVQAEEHLKALGSGEIVGGPSTASPAPQGDAEPANVTPDTSRPEIARWRRWVKALGGS